MSGQPSQAPAEAPAVAIDPQTLAAQRKVLEAAFSATPAAAGPLTDHELTAMFYEVAPDAKRVPPGWLEMARKLAARLATTPQHPGQASEPVAWFDPDQRVASEAFKWCSLDKHTVPVYTHPGQAPAQEPAVHVCRWPDCACATRVCGGAQEPALREAAHEAFYALKELQRLALDVGVARHYPGLAGIVERLDEALGASPTARNTEGQS